MQKNRFYKGTLGIKAEVVIAQALDTSGASSAPQATYKLFIENGVAGSMGTFWDDTGATVATGATALAANAGRKFFYGWKQADGIAMRTTAIPARTRTYTSLPYAAGQPDIITVTHGGTISVGQTINVKIIDDTFPQIPYPSFSYSAAVTSTVAAALVVIAAAINAEKQHDGIFTASASTTVLTLTGVLNRRLKVSAFIETTVAQPTDASAIVIAYTQKSVSPIGTYADIKQLEDQFLVMNGAILYSGQPMLNVVDFQAQSSNVVTGTNYGQLTVTAEKTEKGEVRNYSDKAYVIVALPTASLAALAAL